MFYEGISAATIFHTDQFSDFIDFPGLLDCLSHMQTLPFVNENILPVV